ncbi:MAG: class I SAM-dependent methyltransferase [Clostridia bacterium]|nr:class I SAM-dependent methyltransferase [Clostridia bacterium]
MSDAYRGFASVYDALMYDVDYPGLVEYINTLVPLEGAKVLDLGCGTGSVMTLLDKKHCHVSGMDLSQEMVEMASEKCPDATVVVGDMSCAESYKQLPNAGEFDLVISMLDCMNYISSADLLKKAFENAYETLKSGGHILFDMNTEYKLSQVLGDNFYYDVGDDECYLWENEYDPDRRVCRFDLTFFAKDEDGRYVRIDEVHREYAYSAEEIVDLLKAAGFVDVQVYGNRTQEAPESTEERNFYFAAKP